jgi:NAD-dependent dihydropyrimidine dehydrogenase PreA subunit
MSEKLWYKLASSIVKAGGPPVPINNTLIELLKTLITEDQLKFLLIFRKSLNIDQIKAKIELDDNSLNKMLNDLMHVGLLTGIPSRRTGIMVYRLVAFLPGLLEFTLMRGETGEKQKKLAKLWDQLFKDETEITQKNYDIVMQAFKNAPAIDRVVPVEEQIEVQQELVMPVEELNKLVDKFDTIGVSYCYCRHRKDLLGDPCKMDAPRQNCISLGRSAKFAIDHDFAKQISKKKAKKILKEAEDLGLVHKTFHIRGDPEMEELAICNCCKCCCGNFQSYYNGTSPTHTLTSYISELDKDKCIGCGMCVEKCPMESIELKDTIAELNPDKCIGCGVCAYHCPENAIILKRTGLRSVFVLPPKLAVN